MSIPRFFIDPKYINVQHQSVFCQDAKLNKQIRKVLRLENNDKLDILDGQGNIYHCSLQILAGQNRDIFQAKIQSQENLSPPKKTEIIVGLPLIKINRFEWALEKLTELGVDKIVPVALERSLIKLAAQSNKKNSSFPDHGLKFSRWQKIIQESSEQCERTMPPQLVAPLNFIEWIKQPIEPARIDTEVPNSIPTPALRIICTERQDVQSLETVLYNQKTCPQFCAIALGAEGGFTEEEIKLALSHQFIPVSLGPLILRSETAALYTLAIANALLRLIQTDPSR